MPGLIYSANFGGYDTPKQHVHEQGIEYREIEQGDDGDPLFDARRVKVMGPHLWPGFDWYLWLDATMQITTPLQPLIDQLLESEHDFAAFKHNEWQCAYTEVGKCIDRKKDDPAKLELAAARMLEAGFPKNFGQAATGVLFRKNTKKVHAHALAWWIDMQQTTLRDQCTFMLNVWNQETYVEWIPGLHTDNKWFHYHRGHLK